MKEINIELHYQPNSVPFLEKINDSLPIFSTPKYLEYSKLIYNCEPIWFLGRVGEEILFMVPFLVKRKFGFKKGMFLYAPISLKKTQDFNLEKSFLNEVIAVIKSKKLCDWIEKTPNWSNFKYCPNNAECIPYGTHRLHFENKSEHELFNELNRKMRYSIRKATNDKNISIKSGEDCMSDFYQVVSTKLSLEGILGFSFKKVAKLREIFGENFKIFVVYQNNVPQAGISAILNKKGAYGQWAACLPNASQGSNPLLYWKMLMDCKNDGAIFFDFVGAQPNPNEDSKLFRIQKFKENLGGVFEDGVMWKMVINKNKYKLYQNLIGLKKISHMGVVKSDLIDKKLLDLG